MSESEIEHRFKVRESEDPAEKATVLLRSVGLTLESLKGKKLIVDVGAQDSYIEDYARRSGLFNVASVDKKFPSRISRLILNKIETDATQLPFPDNSADLVISRSGPLFLEQSRTKTIKILEEINRILSENGQHRVHPARFGFIETDLLRTDSEFADISGMAGFSRSKNDIALLDKYRLRANQLSQDFLNSLGYKFSVVKIDGQSQLASNLQEFLIIEKKNVN